MGPVSCHIQKTSPSLGAPQQHQSYHLYLHPVSGALSEGQIQAEGHKFTDSGQKLELCLYSQRNTKSNKLWVPQDWYFPPEAPMEHLPSAQSDGCIHSGCR